MIVFFLLFLPYVTMTKDSGYSRERRRMCTRRDRLECGKREYVAWLDTVGK